MPKAFHNTVFPRYNDRMDNEMTKQICAILLDRFSWLIDLTDNPPKTRKTLRYGKLNKKIEAVFAIGELYMQQMTRQGKKSIFVSHDTMLPPQTSDLAALARHFNGHNGDRSRQQSNRRSVAPVRLESRLSPFAGVPTTAQDAAAVRERGRLVSQLACATSSRGGQISVGTHGAASRKRGKK